jgi:hypothetical protein
MTKANDDAAIEPGPEVCTQLPIALEDGPGGDRS